MRGWWAGIASVLVACASKDDRGGRGADADTDTDTDTDADTDTDTDTDSTLDTVAPELAIDFPAMRSVTVAPVVTIRGRASDDRGASTVTVGGAPAQSVDDFRTWEASVALGVGENEVEVAATDDAGNVAVATVSVERRYEMATPFGGELDPVTGRLYFVDVASTQLLALEPADLDRGIELVAELDELTGATGLTPLDVTVDGDRLLVPCREASATRDVGLWSFDLASGAWSPVSTPSVGAGAAFTNPTRLAVDRVGRRAFVVDYTVPGLFVVDLTTGDRTLLSSNELGDGPQVFGEPQDVVYDAVADRVIVLDRGSDKVFAVDATTGDRSVVSENPEPWTGTQDSLYHALAMELDAPRGRVLVYETYGNHALLGVDLATGTREVLTTNLFGPPYTSDVRLLTLDAANGRVLALDSVYDELLAVDLATGARTSLYDSSWPRTEGPLYAYDLRARDGELWIAGSSGGVSGLHRVDGDAQRTLVAAMTGAAALELEGDTCWLGHGDQVSRVDLRTGASALATGPSVPDDVNPLAWVAALVDLDAATTLVASDTELLVFDDATGARTVLTSATFPEVEPPLGFVSGVAHDPASGLLLTTDWGSDVVLSIDRATGARSVFGPETSGEWATALTFGAGEAFLCDELGVWSIDPATGDRSMILELPGGCQRLDADADRLFLVTWSGAVQQLDRRSGTVVTVAR